MLSQTDASLAAIELSEQELDAVSGGFDIVFSASTFDQSNEFSALQATDSDGGSLSSLSRSSHTSASAVQLVGSGFESVGDALKVLKGLSGLFGNH